MLSYLHHRNSKLFFHPANLDNFKDEKISDYKTVSVAQNIYVTYLIGYLIQKIFRFMSVHRYVSKY